MLASMTGKAGGLPQHGAVVEDDIDAHELLECGQADTYPHDWTNSTPRIQNVFEAGTVLAPVE